MAEEINLEVNVKGGNAKKSIGDTRKELEKTAVSAKKVSDGIKTQATVAVDVRQKLRELQNQMAEIGDVGSKEFQDLAREAGKYKDQMNNANAAIVSMSADFPKLQLGVQGLQAMGAAAQATVGIQALLGTENEQVTKSIQKMIAIQSVSNSLMQFSNLLSDESALGLAWRKTQLFKLTKDLKAFNLVQKIQNALMKAFNFITGKNPLVKLALVLAAVTGAFIWLGKNVKQVGEFFIWMRDLAVGALNSVLEMFGLTDAAIETQSMKERKAFEEKTAQEKAIGEYHDRRLKDIEERRKANKKQNEEENAAFDLEIEINDLLGKSNRALTEEKLQNNTDFRKKESEEIANAIGEWTEYYERLFKLSGKSEEDFKAVMLGRGIDLDDFLTKSVELQEAADDQIRLSEAKLTAFKIKGNKSATKSKDEEAKKQLAIEKKLIADRLKAEQKAQKDWEDLQKRRTDLLEKLSNQVRENRSTEFENRFNKLQEDHDKEMELLNELIPEQHELRLQLERDFQEARREIQVESEEAAEAQRVARIGKIEEDAGKVIDSAEDVAKIVGSLNDLFHGKELKRIEEKQKRGEKLTASEEKRIRKEAKLQKALAVVQIATDTARAISGAIAAGAAIPFPGNIPAMIAGVSAVLANVAAASQVLGESVDIPSSPASAVDSASDVGEQTPNTTALTEGSTLLNPEQSQQVVVVESITEGINSVGVIEAQASFG